MLRQLLKRMMPNGIRRTSHRPAGPEIDVAWATALTPNGHQVTDDDLYESTEDFDILDLLADLETQELADLGARAR